MSAMIVHEVGSTRQCRTFHAPCSECGKCASKYQGGRCLSCRPERGPDLTLDPVRQPTAEEIAWAAGIYEGEGHCSTASSTWQMKVDQKDPELLYRLAEMFGGSVRPRSKTNNTIYVWRVTGPRATAFYEAIRPWLTARRIEQLDRFAGHRKEAS